LPEWFRCARSYRPAPAGRPIASAGVRVAPSWRPAGIPPGRRARQPAGCSQQQLESTIQRSKEALQVVTVVVQAERYANGPLDTQGLHQRLCTVASATHGDALFGQQMRQIAMMNAVDGKAGQRRLGLAQKLYAGTGNQAGQQLFVKFMLMSGYGCGVQPRQVIQGRAKADHGADGWGPGLETQWRGVEFGALEVRYPDHFAAVLPVVELEQGFAAAIQCADPLGSIELVAGEYIE